MSKKQYIGLIILVVIIFASLFYWYEYRPSQIKKECYNAAKEKAIERDGLSNGQFRKESYDTYYGWCLQEKGL